MFALIPTISGPCPIFLSSCLVLQYGRCQWICNSAHVLMMSCLQEQYAGDGIAVRGPAYGAPSMKSTDVATSILYPPWKGI